MPELVRIPGFKPMKLGRRNTVDNVAFITNPYYRPAWAVEEQSDQAPRARAHRYASVDDLLDFIYLGLLTYQAHWEPVGNNPFNVYFPFAPEINKGDKIYNYIKSDQVPAGDQRIVQYEVRALLHNIGVNVVKLDGETAPAAGDILKLDEAAGNVVNFHIGYPNAEDVHYYFDEETLEEKQSEPWVDTITYRVLRTNPAGVRDLFGSPKEYRPRRLETQYEDAYGRNVEYRVQNFDSEIQFDLWSRSNENSEALASWFRYFMNLYTPIFMENGVVQVVFLGKLEDIHVTRWRNDIIARSVRYGVRTQEVTAYDVGVIHRIRATFVAGLSELGANEEEIVTSVDDIPTPSNDFSVEIPHI